MQKSQNWANKVYICGRFGEATTSLKIQEKWLIFRNKYALIQGRLQLEIFFKGSG